MTPTRKPGLLFKDNRDGMTLIYTLRASPTLGRRWSTEAKSGGREPTGRLRGCPGAKRQ